MTLIVFAPDQAAASLMARRLCPKAKIGAVTHLPDEPPDQANIATFWRAISRIAHPSRRPFSLSPQDPSL